MSADTRTYQRVIPVAPGADFDLLRWLTRESFELKAQADAVTIIEYTEEQVTPTNIPDSVAQHLALPLDQYQWWMFTAKAVRPDREQLPDHCGYCAPHPSHRGKCGQDTDDGKACRCPGWPL